MSELHFQNDLNDAYDLVLSKAKKGKATCKDLLAFYEARASAEEAFVVALKKIPTESLFGETNEQSTFRTAWDAVRKSITSQIQEHSQYAKTIREEIIPSLSNLLTELRVSKKQMEASEKKAKLEYQKAEKNTLKARKAHSAQGQRVYSAMTRLEAQQAQGIPVNDRDRNNVVEASEAASSSLEELERAERDQTVIQQLYQETLSNVLNTFEENEKKRLEVLRKCILDDALSRKEAYMNDLQLSDNGLKTACMVDPSCDIAELIIDLKSQIQDRSPIGALSETTEVFGFSNDPNDPFC